MKPTNLKFKNFWKLSVACGTVLLGAGSIYGDVYFFGGTSYWPNYELPQTTIPDFRFNGYEESSVDRNTELWIGAGYKINKEWSFEGFYSKLTIGFSEDQI